jgi:hypothetical protein
MSELDKYGTDNKAITDPKVEVKKPGTDWAGFAQTIGSLMSGYGAIKGVSAAKKGLQFEKEAFNFNKDMSIASNLANAQGQKAAMLAGNPQANVSFYDSLISKLQSYGPAAQPQQQAQQPLQQQQPQQPLPPQGNPMGNPQGGYNSLNNYGPRG